MMSAHGRVLRGASVVALAAAGIVAGCGRDEGTGPPTSASTSTTEPPTVAAPPPGRVPCSGDEPVRSADLALAVRPLGPLVAGNVSWHLTVTNEGAAAVELVYPTGQDGDIVLRDATGAEAFRWSAALSFTQAVRCQVLAPGHHADLFLGGVLRVPPGRYELEATVAASPAPEPVVAEVSVSA
jgi:hypothetical protein